MVTKVGGIDSNYLSMARPEMAKTLGGPESLMRLSPGRDDKKASKSSRSKSKGSDEEYKDDDFEPDSRQEGFSDL